MHYRDLQGGAISTPRYRRWTSTPRDIAQEAPELQMIQAEILIIKTSRCAWNLIHEELDSRWQECHPDADLIRKF